MPYIGHRHADILGKRAGAIHADADGVFAQMPPPGETVATPPADDVALRTDDFAAVEIAHIGADRHHLADEFMADDHRHRDGFLCPRIPVIDMQICAADPGFTDFDQHIIDANDGLRHVPQPQPGF